MHTPSEGIYYINEFSSNSEAYDIVNRILEATGMQADFRIRAAKISNALATYENGKYLILYNPQFISQLKKASGTYWSSVSVVAHEVGHILKGHITSNNFTAHERELQADEYSGFAMRALGATLEESEACMKTIADHYGSDSHPAQYKRIASIKKGWNRANEQIAIHSEEKEQSTASNKSSASKSTPVKTLQKEKVECTHITECSHFVYYKTQHACEHLIRTNYGYIKKHDHDVILYKMRQHEDDAEHDFDLKLQEM